VVLARCLIPGSRQRASVAPKTDRGPRVNSLITSTAPRARRGLPVIRVVAKEIGRAKTAPGSPACFPFILGAWVPKNLARRGKDYGFVRRELLDRIGLPGRCRGGPKL